MVVHEQVQGVGGMEEEGGRRVGEDLTDVLLG